MTTPAKSIYLHFAQDDGCRFHRLLMPARFTQQDLPDIDLVCQSDPPRDNEPHDAYVLHGLCMMDSLGRAGWWQWRKSGFVWSVDDDWQTVPDWNPAKPVPEAMSFYSLARSAADYILCSTDHLGGTFDGRYADKVIVAPNMMDVRMYPCPAPPPVKDDEMLRVVWAGGPTHRNDVLVMVPAIQRLLDKYPDKFHVCFFGQAPPHDLIKSHLNRGVYWERPVDLGTYAPALSTVLKPHVWLAPLSEIPFNLSKSGIRIFEGWSLSAAVLCTPWGEYARVRDGEDGLWCRDPDEWEDNLERVILDKDLREGLARAGRRRVLEEYDWCNPKCREPWRRAFTKIAGVAPDAHFNGTGDIVPTVKGLRNGTA